MQSTGHTSTHALSFTLMHGSAIMYGIKASRDSELNWSDRHVVTRRFQGVKHFARLTSAAKSRSAPAPPGRCRASGAWGVWGALRGPPCNQALLTPQPRIEGVAQGVAEQVE